MKTALVAGSTGLIGKQLLQLLLDSDRYDKVKALTRSDLNISHPKLSQIKPDFRRLIDFKHELSANDIFCCLGTTMAKVKSKEKFYEVDFTFPSELAKAGSEQGAQQFLLVSALGADHHSSIFYNRVKGELEEAISRIHFDAIHIFRPSLLLGPREEHRSGEEAAKIFYKIFGFVIPGKYKAIDSAKVAQAMLYYASLEEKGIFIYESRDLQRIHSPQ
jgi:uncharacterized protein YbjT (DUF2867 family)